MHDVAWRGMGICVRSKDAQKQLARTSLKYTTWNARAWWIASALQMRSTNGRARQSKSCAREI